LALKLFPTIGGERSIIVNPLDSIAGSKSRQNVSTSLDLLLPGKVRPDGFKSLLL